MRPSLNCLSAVSAIVLAVAGCGRGGGGPTGSGYNATPTGGTSVPTDGSANVVVVDISNYAYSQQTITVKSGTTVKWVNGDAVAHTATADAGQFDSGSLSTAGTGYDPTGYGAPAAATYSRSFNTTGTFKYHCSLHPTAQYPNFTGTVIVTQ